MRTRRSLTVVIALLVALAAAGARQDQPVVEWIRANAIPLAGVEAGHGFADLQPLKRLIGHARIESLGEATHGSREIFQLKHRMVEFLATEMGFTVFALDLRQAPAWFMKPHDSRQIGAVYPEDDPYAYLANIVAPDAFDAILFIDQTTAARKNPGR